MVIFVYSGISTYILATQAEKKKNARMFWSQAAC